MMTPDNTQANLLGKLVASALRSLAASFPVAASLGQAWSEYETHRTGRRIQELLDNFQDEFRRLAEQVRNCETTVQAIEGFPEIVERTVEKVRREFEASKRALYATMLARLAVSGSKYSYDEKTTLIESLDALTELDLKVLRQFKGKGELAAKAFDCEALGVSGVVNVQLQELACCLGKLE